MSIRPDLEDISNTVEHLLSLGEYFCENTHVWSTLWYANGRTYSLESNLYKTRDNKFIKAVEEVYKLGADTADTLADVLPKINNIRDCPRLKDYVEEIKGCQEQADSDEKVLSDCKQVISQKNEYAVDNFAISQMLALNAKQIKILRGLVSELRVIEGSERYRIEEHDLLLSKENERIATPGPASNSQEEQPKQDPAKGFKWENIQIVVLDDDTVKVGNNGPYIEQKFFNLGFADKRIRREKKPSKLWNIFLSLAEKKIGSCLDADPVKCDKKDIQLIRRKLEQYFNTKENPIDPYNPHNKDWHCKFHFVDMRHHFSDSF